MIEHIVKNNEDVSDILNMYHIDLSTLKEYNSHITDFKNLLSGTKLMIPLIHQEIEQILDKTEAFVMDYYPQITEDIIPSMQEEKKEAIVGKREETMDEAPPVLQDSSKPKQEEVRAEEKPIRKIAYPGVLPPKKPYKGI